MWASRLKSEIGKNMSKLTKICKTENNSVGHHVSTYTGVQSFVHYLLHHMAAHAYRHKFGPLTISSEFWSHDKFLSNTQVWSIFKLIESANLVQIRGGQFSNRLRFCYRFTTESTTEFDSVNGVTGSNSVVNLLWFEKKKYFFYNRITTDFDSVNSFTD